MHPPGRVGARKEVRLPCAALPLRVAGETPPPRAPAAGSWSHAPARRILPFPSMHRTTLGGTRLPMAVLLGLLRGVVLGGGECVRGERAGLGWAWPLLLCTNRRRPLGSIRNNAALEDT
jgi:hypothetical protein